MLMGEGPFFGERFELSDIDWGSRYGWLPTGRGGEQTDRFPVGPGKIIPSTLEREGTSTPASPETEKTEGGFHHGVRQNGG